MSAQRVVLQLEPDAFLPLRGMEGARVACLEGVLWITHDGDPNDILVQAGQAHQVTREGACVQAIGASRMAVEAATPKWGSRGIRALTPIAAS